MSQKLDQVVSALEKRLQLFVDSRKRKEWKFKAGRWEVYKEPDWEKVKEIENAEANTCYCNIIKLRGFNFC